MGRVSSQTKVVCASSNMTQAPCCQELLSRNSWRKEQIMFLSRRFRRESAPRNYSLLTLRERSGLLGTSPGWGMSSMRRAAKVKGTATSAGAAVVGGTSGTSDVGGPGVVGWGGRM